MLSLVATDATDHGPRLDNTFTDEQELELHLEQTRADASHKHWLFGSLLAGQVYVVDYEIILGHDGPLYELKPRTRAGGRTVAVYTSRAKIPTRLDPADAEPMAFAEVLHMLEDGVGLTLNPEGPRSHTIPADELALLRRVLEAA